MALATQCPQCLTIFRVANDQLKLRGGLVRCGSCKNVFNGNEYLVEAGISDGFYHPAPGSRAQSPGLSRTAAATDDTVPVVNTPAPPPAQPTPLPPPPPPAPALVPAEAPVAAPVVPPIAAPVAAPIPLQQEPRVFRSPTSPGYIPDLGAPLKTDDTLGQEDFPLPQTPSALGEDEPAELDQPILQTTRDEAGPELQPEPGPEPESQSQPAPEPAGSDPAPLPLDDLGFVRKAERRARVGHVTQIVMLVLAAVMVPVLLLQATYYWRNQIAAGAPALRPMLNGMCVAFHCTVGVPADIDRLSLESNELQVVPPNQNIYALSLVMRNRSDSAQAWPAIELTLNNDDEKPVVRRVFRPREYLSDPLQIDNGIRAESEQLVKLTFELDNALVSGYRIYLFYP